MMLEKKIEIDSRFGKEYKGKYVFQSITWGRNNEITSDCTSINPLTKQSKVDFRKLQGLMLDATMIERPSAITLEKLMDLKNGIPMALGELLMSAADYVNGFGTKEREELKKLKQQWNLD